MKVRPIVLLFAISLIAFAGFLIFLLGAGDEDAKSAANETETNVSYQVKEGFIQIAEDFRWEALSESELRELNGFFGDETSPHSFQSTIVVFPGETVITDSYEGLSGEFVFSQLTPEITEGEDGLPAIEVFTEAKKILLDGTIETISQEPVEAPPGGLSYSIGTNEGIYRLMLIGNQDSSTGLISLDLEGKFVQRPE